MENFIIIAIVLIIVACAAAYIIRAKKRGAKCIGCPAASNCSSNKKNNASDGCGCGCCGCDAEK